MGKRQSRAPDFPVSWKARERGTHGVAILAKRDHRQERHLILRAARRLATGAAFAPSRQRRQAKSFGRHAALSGGACCGSVAARWVNSGVDKPGLQRVPILCFDATRGVLTDCRTRRAGLTRTVPLTIVASRDGFLYLRNACAKTGRKRITSLSGSRQGRLSFLVFAACQIPRDRLA
jgi:hypothetical protein